MATGMLRPEDQPPPLVAQPVLATFQAVLAAGLLGGELGQDIIVSGTVTDFFAKIREWHTPPLRVLPAAAGADAYDFDKESPTSVMGFVLEILHPEDPNDIVAPAGYGPQHFVRGDEPLSYQIRFENHESATAPVSQIIIRQLLDPDADERSFRLGSIQLGDIRIDPPADQAFFTTEVDLRSGHRIVVRVTAGIDVENRQAFWIISALDPDTGELMDDPRFGLLPPQGDRSDAQGQVTYSINAFPSSPSGARIDAAASIIFDTNAALETQPVFNTLDVAAPVTALTVVKPNAAVPVYNLSWTALDEVNGAGMQDTTIYVSENGGAFVVWLNQTTETSAVYVGAAGSTYRFAARSRDHVGNVEFIAELLAPASGSQSSVTEIPVNVPQSPADAANVAADSSAEPSLPFSFINPDFSVRTFAWGFADSGAGIGPRGIVFLPNGDVLISNGAARNSLYRLTAAGGQVGAPIALNSSYPIYDLALDSAGRVWATTGGGPLLRLDPTTGAVLAQYGPDGARGLAVDPLTDDIFYSSNEGIIRLNTFTGKITRFSTLRVDGMDFSPDGTLWTLSWPDRGELLRWDRHGVNERVATLPGGADGIAAGRPGSPFADKIVVNSNNGTVSLVDPITGTVTILASGGSRGDFAKSGPHGGIFVTQLDQIVVFEGLQTNPEVIASNPMTGDHFTQSITSATVTFSLDMFAGSPTSAHSVTNPANYLLVGDRLGPRPIASVSYDGATRTASLQLGTLPSDRYVLLVRPEIESVASVEMAAPYTALFTVSVAPEVTGSTPANGAPVPPGLTSAQITFSRPMWVGQTTDTGSVLNVANYHLLGQNYGPAAIQSVTYDNATRTATLHFASLPADFYVLGIEKTVESFDAVALGHPFEARFTQLADVTGDFRITFSNTRTNRTNGTEITDLSLQNTSNRSIRDRLVIVFENLAPSGVTLAGASGLTSAGHPYLDLDGSYGGNGLFSPDERVAMGSVTFSNPEFDRIDFTSRLLAYPVERNHLPVIASPPVLTAAMGASYEYQVQATDADNDHLQYSLADGPGGMVIDHESGLILWNPLPGTPDQVPVKVQVFEELGNWTTQEFVISFTDPNQPPTLQPIGNRRIQPGRNVTFTLSGSDPEDAPLSYFATNLPSGATFNTTTGTFSWTPAAGQSGAYLNLLFAVSDGTREDHEFIVITVDGDSATISSYNAAYTASADLAGASVTISGDLKEGSEITAIVDVSNAVPEETNVRFTFEWGDSTGGAFNTHTYEDNGTYTVRSLIWDLNTGFYLGDTTTTVTIENVAPTAAVTNNGPVDVNYPVKITVNNQFDPSSVDTQDRFTYLYDWDGDGTFDQTVTDPSVGAHAFNQPHTYDKSGTYTVTVRIADEDSGEPTYYTEYTTTVVVYPPYYGYTAIAVAGPESSGYQLGSLGDSPSINDRGTVAFTAHWGNVSGIFASNGTASPNDLLNPNSDALITGGSTLSTRDFGRAAAINNLGDVNGRIYITPIQSTYQIGTRLVPGPFGPRLVPEYITVADPPQTIIRTWKADGTVVTAATAGGRRDSESLAALLQGKPNVESLLNFTDIDEAGNVAYTYTFQYDYQHRWYTLYQRPQDSTAPREGVVADLPYGTFTRPQVTSGLELKADPAELLDFVRTQYEPASEELNRVADEIMQSSIAGITDSLRLILKEDVVGLLTPNILKLYVPQLLKTQIWKVFHVGVTAWSAFSTVKLIVQASALGDRLDQALARWEQVNAEYARLADPVVPSKVLYQAGNQADSPIVLRHAGDEDTVIASRSMDFYAPFPSNSKIGTELTVIGRNPGVGNEGEIVAFSGRGLLSNGRQEDGIFISVPDSQGGRRIIRIVSPLSGPNGTQFTSIDPKDRVAVNDVDSAGMATVALMATNDQGQRGLYTIQLHGLGTEMVTLSPVFTVARAGDTIPVTDASGNLTYKVTKDIGINDPINNNGDLAYWATTETSGEQLILLAGLPNIKVTDLKLESSQQIELSYTIERHDLSTPVRIEVGLEDALGHFTSSGHLEVYSDRILAFDNDGNSIDQSPLAGVNPTALLKQGSFRIKARVGDLNWASDPGPSKVVVLANPDARSLGLLITNEAVLGELATVTSIENQAQVRNNIPEKTTIDNQFRSEPLFDLSIFFLGWDTKEHGNNPFFGEQLRTVDRGATFVVTNNSGTSLNTTLELYWSMPLLREGSPASIYSTVRDRVRSDGTPQTKTSFFRQAYTLQPGVNLVHVDMPSAYLNPDHDSPFLPPQWRSSSNARFTAQNIVATLFADATSFGFEIDRDPTDNIAPLKGVYVPDSDVVDWTYAAEFRRVNNTGETGTGALDRRNESQIEQVIVHALGGYASSAINGWQGLPPYSEANPYSGKETATHYLVTQLGNVYQFIPERLKADHATASSLKSVGIEFEDENRSEDPGWAKDGQLANGARLVRDIALRRQIYTNVSGFGGGPALPPETRHLIDHPAVVPLEDYEKAGIDVKRVPFDRPSASYDASPPDYHDDGYTTADKGIIKHGQVFDRTRDREDPRKFEWVDFMARVNGGIAFELTGDDTVQGTATQLRLLVIDGQGRKSGYDPTNGSYYDQIPGQVFNGNEYWNPFIAIPLADEGPYTIKVVSSTVTEGILKVTSGFDSGFLGPAVARVIPRQHGVPVVITYQYRKGAALEVGSVEELADQVASGGLVEVWRSSNQGEAVRGHFSNVVIDSELPFNGQFQGVGVSVTAAGPQGGNAFRAVDALSQGYAGTLNTVWQESGASGNVIQFTFSTPLLELHDMYFALNSSDSRSVKMVLEAYLRGELVATQAISGFVSPNGTSTEGVLSFYGSPFDTLRIRSDNPSVKVAVGEFDVMTLPGGDALPQILIDPVGGDSITGNSEVTVTGYVQSAFELDSAVIYRLDGQTAQSSQLTIGTRRSAGTLALALADLADGDHTIVISATDRSGNFSDVSVTFHVDGVAPQVRLLPIGTLGYVNAISVTVIGEVVDDFRVGDNAYYSFDGAPLIPVATHVGELGVTAQLAILLEGITTGPHSLTVVGSDRAGNQVATTVTFTVDTSPAAVALPIGRDGFTNSTSPALSGIVADEFAVGDSVIYSLDGSGPLTIPLTPNTSGTQGTFVIPTSGLAEGTHTISLTTTDKVGNAITQTLTFVVDLSDPTLGFDPIGNQGYLIRSPITGSLTDDRRLFGSIEYSFDNDPRSTAPVSLDPESKHGTFSIPTLGQADGPHVLTVFGQDQAGNEVQRTTPFIVDTQGPGVTGITPSGTNFGGSRTLVIGLSADQIVEAEVTKASNWHLHGSGGDAVFGDVNAFSIPLFDDQIAYDPATRTVTITLPAPLTEDFYKLTIKGSGVDVMHDLAGNPFNDGVDFLHSFVVLNEPAVTNAPDKTFRANRPLDLATADFDGDGRSDLVSVDAATGILTVALNENETTWRSVEQVDLGLGAIHGLVTGDFNGDGKADVLLRGATSVFLVVGDGTGTLTLNATLTPAGLTPLPGQGRIGLLAADVNGDSHLDALILSPAAGEVLVFMGDGAGAFAQPLSFLTGGAGPVDLALGDFLGGPALDLAIADQAGGGVTFLEGDGLGGFILRETFTVSGLGTLHALVAGDFNSDGRMDLAAAAGSNVFLLINTVGVIQVVPLANGDFENGLTGWTLEMSRVLPDAGTVQVIGGVATFHEGTSGRVTLSQRLLIPAGATSLRFDLVGNGLEEALDGTLPDAFEVSLLDGNGDSLFPGIGVDLTAYSNVAPGGVIRLGNGVTMEGNRVTLDLTGISIETDATLYLDLIGNGPEAGSTVSVDNFTVLVAPVLTRGFASGNLAGPHGLARNIATGDVDGDGRTDLLVTDASGRLVVYGGDGQGGFARTELGTARFGAGPMALVTGKFAGEIADDIAYSLFDSGLIVSPLRFSIYDDITGRVEINYSATQLDRLTDTVSFLVTMTNISAEPVSGAIYFALTGLSPLTVQAENPTGRLDDGSPYFDFSGLTGDGILQPGETTAALLVSLENPLLASPTFNTVVLNVPEQGDEVGGEGGGLPPTVIVSETEIAVGSTITVRITGSTGEVGVWAGLFNVRDSDVRYVDWYYLDGTRRQSNAGRATGTLTFTSPRVAGSFEIRVFAAGSYDLMATSAPFTVTGGDLETPSTPVITSFDSDTGVSNQDRLTADSTLTFGWLPANDFSGIAGYWWAIDNATPEKGGTFTTDLHAMVVGLSNGIHTLYVRAVDASPAANLSEVAGFVFELDTRAPQVVATVGPDGGPLAAKPRVIDIRFSEAMNRLAGELAPSDLALSGAGVGQARVATASWMDDHTARFTIDGEWGVGEVTMGLVAGALQDPSGNLLQAYFSTFTIEAEAPTRLTLSGTQVNAGGSMTVSLHNGPGNPGDRLALYPVDAPDAAPLDWVYLNGSRSVPVVGRTEASWTVTAPVQPGAYEFRLLSDGHTLMKSAVLVVRGIEIFLDFDGGYLADLPGVVEVGNSTGRVHDGFQGYSNQSRDSEIQQILAGVAADFAAYAVQVIHDDNWQTNPLFGEGDTVIFIGGNGLWVAGNSNPTVNNSSVRWVAGMAPWDIGNLAANIAFTFSAATAEAAAILGWSESRFIQHVTNTISHEIAHTLGVDHVTRQDGTNDLMGTAETGTQINGDGVFSEVSLPRQHGGSYSSDAFLRDVLGAAGAGALGAQTLAAAAATASHPGDDILISSYSFDLSEALTRLLTNGDFTISDPAGPDFAWVQRAAALIAGGAAVLNEHSESFTGMTQSFVVPANAKILQFTITGASLNSNAGYPPDAFEVALLDRTTLVSLMPRAAGLESSDAFLNFQQSGEIYFGQGVTVAGAGPSGAVASLNFPVTVEVDISGIAAGTEVTLFFDLLGFNPAGSSVTIDNVQILGTPEVVEVVINGGAAQRSMVTTVSVRFSEDVSASVDLGDFRFTNVTTGQVVPLAAMALDYQSLGNVVVITVPGLTGRSFTDGNYRLTIDATGISIAAGQALSTAELETLNGEPVFRFHRLFGDQDGDRDVDFLDTYYYQLTSNRHAPEPQYDWRFDSEADADVDALDLFRFAQNYFKVLSPESAISGDMNGDGAIDQADTSAFQQAYQTASKGGPYDASADFDGDLDVDAIDLFAFSRVYTTANSLPSAQVAPASVKGDQPVNAELKSGSAATRSSGLLVRQESAAKPARRLVPPRAAALHADNQANTTHETEYAGRAALTLEQRQPVEPVVCDREVKQLATVVGRAGQGLPASRTQGFAALNLKIKPRMDAIGEPGMRPNRTAAGNPLDAQWVEHGHRARTGGDHRIDLSAGPVHKDSVARALLEDLQRHRGGRNWRPNHPQADDSKLSPEVGRRDRKDIPLHGQKSFTRSNQGARAEPRVVERWLNLHRTWRNQLDQGGIKMHDKAEAEETVRNWLRAGDGSVAIQDNPEIDDAGLRGQRILRALKL
ncbi:MAG: Ig-like domain-containing protein [Verrucomicrobiales bacterium]